MTHLNLTAARIPSYIVGRSQFKKPTAAATEPVLCSHPSALHHTLASKETARMDALELCARTSNRIAAQVASHGRHLSRGLSSRLGGFISWRKR